MKKQINQRDAEGREHGVWEWYYQDGTVQWRGHYHHGKRHGVWEGYYSDGTLAWRGQFHHGVRRGLDVMLKPQGGIIDKRYHLVIR